MINPMPLLETSLWSATTAPLKSFADKPLPAKADVVVIGGGYTGVSAALRLAKHGASVTLLEAQTIGWGASSRNGGQVLTGLKHGASDLIRQFGKERARELYHASVKTIECVENIIAEDASTVRFNLEVPFVFLPNPLGTRYGKVLKAAGIGTN